MDAEWTTALEMLIRTGGEWDPGHGKSKYPIQAISEGKDLDKLAFGSPPIVEQNRVEEDVQSPKGFVVKTVSREPVNTYGHRNSDFGFQRASHNSLMNSISTLNTSPARSAFKAHFCSYSLCAGVWG